MHSFGLTGIGECELVYAIHAAAGAAFHRRVEEALTTLQAGDRESFDAFAPGVRALAGWRAGGATTTTITTVTLALPLALTLALALTLTLTLTLPSTLPLPH